MVLGRLSLDNSAGDTDMTEEQILDWMRQKVKQEGFTDAASIAGEFLQAHHINNSLDPEFSITLDAGFKIAKEMHGF